MWCRHCQQQTPAVGPTTEFGPRCARCHRTTPAQSPSSEIQSDTEAPQDVDSARREIYRQLRSAHATLSAGETATTLRFDLVQTGLTASQDRPNALPNNSVARPEKPTISASNPKATTGQAFAWLTASTGAAILGLGLGLLGWSLFGNQPGLWNPGLAAAIAGQGLVIIGLLNLLSNLWSATRQAAFQLDQVHGEMRRMRRAQEESAGRHSATAASFYSNLARDAGPDVLLGNLQGQVDRLSARLRAE